MDEIIPIRFSTQEEANVILANVQALEKRLIIIGTQITKIIKRKKPLEKEMLKTINKQTEIKDNASVEGRELTEEEDQEIEELEIKYGKMLAQYDKNNGLIGYLNTSKNTIKEVIKKARQALDDFTSRQLDVLTREQQEFVIQISTMEFDRITAIIDDIRDSELRKNIQGIFTSITRQNAVFGPIEQKAVQEQEIKNYIDDSVRGIQFVPEELKMMDDIIINYTKNNGRDELYSLVMLEKENAENELLGEVGPVQYKQLAYKGVTEEQAPIFEGDVPKNKSKRKKIKTKQEYLALPAPPDEELVVQQSLPGNPRGILEALAEQKQVINPFMNIQLRESPNIQQQIQQQIQQPFQQQIQQPSNQIRITDIPVPMAYPNMQMMEPLQTMIQPMIQPIYEDNKKIRKPRKKGVKKGVKKVVKKTVKAKKIVMDKKGIELYNKLKSLCKKVNKK